MPGPSALASLETAGDNTGVWAEWLGQRVPGAWQGGRPADTWSAGGGGDYRTSAEKEDGQCRLDLGIDLRNGHTAADGVESKRCAKSGLNLASWQRPF